MTWPPCPLSHYPAFSHIVFQLGSVTSHFFYSPPLSCSLCLSAFACAIPFAEKTSLPCWTLINHHFLRRIICLYFVVLTTVQMYMDLTDSNFLIILLSSLGAETILLAIISLVPSTVSMGFHKLMNFVGSILIWTCAQDFQWQHSLLVTDLTKFRCTFPTDPENRGKNSVQRQIFPDE